MKDDNFKGFCADPYMDWSPFSHDSICRKCRCFIPSETGKLCEESCSELGVEGWNPHDILDVQLTNECIFFIEKKPYDVLFCDVNKI